MLITCVGVRNLGEGVPAMFTRLLHNKLHMDRVKIMPALFIFSLNTAKQQGSVKGGDRQGNNCRHPRYTSRFTAGWFAISCVPR